MAFTIPTETFDDYFEACDELINNTYIGVDITLFYPETITQVTDTSHHLNLVDGPPTNFGSEGNLNNFERMGGGTSYSKVENTEGIRVRWYPDPKEWKRILSVNIPEVKVLMIGYLSDWEKIVRANQIGYNFGGVVQRYSLACQLQPWGFGNRYFVGQLKEA